MTKLYRVRYAYGPDFSLTSGSLQAWSLPMARECLVDELRDTLKLNALATPSVTGAVILARAAQADVGEKIPVRMLTQDGIEPLFHWIEEIDQ